MKHILTELVMRHALEEVSETLAQGVCSQQDLDIALAKAAYLGDLEMASILLRHGANPNPSINVACAALLRAYPRTLATFKVTIAN